MASTEADVAQPLQEDINSLQQEVDKKVLRPAHKQSFTCSAKCCDKNTAPEEFQKCLEPRFISQKCREDVESKTSVVQSELENFQQKVQSCVQGCQAQAQARRDSGDTERASERMMECASECVQTYRNLVPQLRSTIFKKAN